MSTTHRNTVHYTQLAPTRPDSPLATEWETYRREVGRLLAEGHEGKFVLIKGTEIVGLYDTQEAARDVGVQRYLLEAHLIHQVRTEEPILRIRGHNLPLPCRR